MLTTLITALSALTFAAIAICALAIPLCGIIALAACIVGGRYDDAVEAERNSANVVSLDKRRPRV